MRFLLRWGVWWRQAEEGATSPSWAQALKELARWQVSPKWRFGRIVVSGYSFWSAPDTVISFTLYHLDLKVWWSYGDPTSHVVCHVVGTKEKPGCQNMHIFVSERSQWQDINCARDKHWHRLSIHLIVLAYQSKCSYSADCSVSYCCCHLWPSPPRVAFILAIMCDYRAV